MIRKWKKFPFSWLLPVLFFAALWLLGTTGIYNDSNQYIAMHIHREPLYSFFLWIFRSLFGETRYLDIVTGAPHYHAGIFCERTGFVERRHQRSAGTAAVLSVYGAVHEDGVYKTEGSSFILPAVILIFVSGTRTDDVHDPALAGVCRGRRDRRKKEAGETPVDLCRVHCAGVWYKDASRKKLQPCF